MPKGRDRNKPCSCGSGRKYKKCCWDIHRVVANQVIEDGHSESYSLKNGKKQNKSL